jgi:hypothetical protein
MPWLFTFMPSTAIATLEVYVKSLHRCQSVMESFLVWMLGEASLSGTSNIPCYLLWPRHQYYYYVYHNNNYIIL